MSSLPIIRRYEAQLNKRDVQRAIDLADVLQSENPRLTGNDYFEPYARTGLTENNHIVFGDTSEIPHARNTVSGYLEYRLSVLASDGDLVVMAHRRDQEFEAYLKRVLGTSNLEFADICQLAEENRMPSTMACLKLDECFEILKRYTLARRQTTLLPHISTGAVWALARRLGSACGTTIHIAGPQPVISDRVNDKIWFADVARRLFGAPSVPREHAAHNMTALVSRIKAFARRSERLVIKVPNSAGSQGNFPIESKHVSTMRPRELATYLSSMIQDAGWDISYPLMVQVWDENVLSSPSIQLWIPHAADGLPIAEGIFQQVTVGPVGRFQGATRADLPKSLRRSLVDGATLLGIIFQRLGYFGRCSVDTVLTGANADSASFHWIECNGRWGGVSVPMTLTNRILPQPTAGAFAVVQRQGLSYPPRQFSDILACLEKLLWMPGATRGIIITSPRRLTEGTGADFMTIDESEDAAILLAEEALDCLT